MKDIKNYLIAILAGLLVLTLSTQNSNGATVKTYDAVKLVQYDRCLDFFVTSSVAGRMNFETGYQGAFSSYVSGCASYKP